MTHIKALNPVIIALLLGITIGMAGHFLSGPASVDAARLYKYKVVTMGPANTVYEYEKLLNDMAYQGWTFDHMVADQQWTVFKK